MAFCMLYYLVSKHYSEQYFFLLCWEEGIVSNSDLMSFELSQKQTFHFGNDVIFLVQTSF